MQQLPKTRQPRRRKSTSRLNASAMVLSAIGGAVLFGAISSAGFARPSISAETFRQVDLFGDVFEQVHSNYVTEADAEDLILGAIDGMMSTLDPHSNYLSPDKFKVMREQTSGSFHGLGIQVTMDKEGPDKGVVKVVAPIDDTPAKRAGLKTDDLIVKIDDEKVLGMTIDEAISKLKGKKGTKVKIHVVRDRAKDPFPVLITRDTVRVQSVTHRAEGDYGYVRISTFNEQTTVGLKKALKKLKKEISGGAKGFVIDLRSNPGGLLNEAVSISDAFLRGGEIVSTRGRHLHDNSRKLGSTKVLVDDEVPVIILIDGGSASASEIVAGALQDRGRALLLGTKSFGKGSVQTLIPLSNGARGAVRLTTAKYYTPSGTSIQATGIVPDIRMPVIYPGQDEVSERPHEKDLPNALGTSEETSDVAPEANETSDETTAELPEVEPVKCGKKDDGKVRDCQLERALEILADEAQYRQLLAEAAVRNASLHAKHLETEASDE